MAIKITLGNSKGGIGKTTISGMLSYYLATEGYKVLLIDLDPQANATYLINNTFYPNEEKEHTTIYEGLTDNIQDAIHKVDSNFHFIAGSQNTANIRFLLNKQNQFTFLKDAIQDIEKDYDFVFYDIPPTIFTDFFNNALAASGYFIILTETSDYSFKGISDMYNTAKEISSINEKLDFLGILINMREDDREVIEQLDSKYNIHNEEMFFKTYIPKRKRITKYATDGMFGKNNTSAVKYDRWDKEMFEVFENLKNELFEKIGGVKQ